jgi:hypothetical protein
MTVSQQPQQASLDNHKPALKERGELADLKKRCEDRIKELDETLRPVLEGRGTIATEGYSFTCTLSKGRKSIDKDALNEFLSQHGMSVENFEKEGAPFTTMTVKKMQVI